MINSNYRGYLLVAGIAAACISLLWPYVLYTPTKPNSGCDTSLPKFNITGQSQVCIALAEALPENVYSEQNSCFHEIVLGAYANQAREETPTCIVQLYNAQQVSSALKVLKAEFDSTKRLTFAVRSGGHAPGPGRSSIHGGVLIDLGPINDVTVSEDRKSTIIGTGARWGDVYSTLEALGLAVAGGRDADVGVGGLALGGGISYFSPRVGMVCDNIIEYEIVLANGTITSASETQNPDLWRALKGGGGNFGIVTRFTSKSFPSTKIWGGYLYWPYFQAPKVLKALHEFGKLEVVDEYASSPIISLAYKQVLGFKAMGGMMVYTKPERWPQILSGFNVVWRLWSTVKIRALGDMASELQGLAPSGLRQLYATMTIKNDLDTLNLLPELTSKSVEQIAKVKGITYSLVLQPLPPVITHKGSPNALGLQPRNTSETLVIVLISTSWELAADDDLVYRTSHNLIAAVDQLATDRHTEDRFRYLNYVGDWQDPISGYGKESKTFLQQTSRQYDPDGLFQEAMKGRFNLDMY